MELQNFITKNKNYIDLFKENNLKVKKYSKYNCIIVSNHYDNNLIYTDESDYWKMYCRGAVIDTVKNKIICLPPSKSIDVDIDDINFDNPEVQVLLDGTMINLFYKDEWIISTRSEIGGYNKWSDKKSFGQMFEDCLDFDYKLLNKNNSYSFVMRHIDNRNVSPITLNELYLVEVYSYRYKNVTRLPVTEYPDILKIDNITNLDTLNEISDYYFKGYTIKQGKKRYKLINNEYEKVKELKGSYNNDMLHYFELRKNNKLKEYLKYFPEKNKYFLKYRNELHDLSNELYSFYKRIYIHKSIEKKEIPYYLKPLTRDIHKQYLNTKVPTSWNHIKEYVNSLPSKRLVFALNYKNKSQNKKVL